MSEFIRLIRDEMGATAVEYSLIVALISMAAIFALSAMGVSLSDLFTLIVNKLQ